MSKGALRLVWDLLSGTDVLQKHTRSQPSQLAIQGGVIPISLGVKDGLMALEDNLSRQVVEITRSRTHATTPPVS